MAKIYAGIGSRRASVPILDLMFDIGYKLASEAWLLRSGAAEGCDTAIEDGVFEYGMGTDYGHPETNLSRLQEIYIPWNNFNGHYHNPDQGIYCIENDVKADKIAQKYHPAYQRLSKNAKKLMARNAYQLLGSTLDDPVRFVIAWTPDGCDGIKIPRTKESGGTAQAITIANAYNVPVYNLAQEEHFNRLNTWLKE